MVFPHAFVRVIQGADSNPHARLGGFKYFNVIFTPTWGNDQIWLYHILSNGLKPPTSLGFRFAFDILLVWVCVCVCAWLHYGSGKNDKGCFMITPVFGAVELLQKTTAALWTNYSQLLESPFRTWKVWQCSRPFNGPILYRTWASCHWKCLVCLKVWPKSSVLDFSLRIASVYTTVYTKAQEVCMARCITDQWIRGWRWIETKPDIAYMGVS